MADRFCFFFYQPTLAIGGKKGKREKGGGIPNRNSAPSSASPGISPKPPAVYAPLPGDDETARLPSPVSMLSPLAASKRPTGALSPTDVALFPTFQCTAEGCLKEASHTPGNLPPGGCPGNPLCGLSVRSAALY